MRPNFQYSLQNQDNIRAWPQQWGSLGKGLCQCQKNISKLKKTVFLVVRLAAPNGKNCNGPWRKAKVHWHHGVPESARGSFGCTFETVPWLVEGIKPNVAHDPHSACCWCSAHQKKNCFTIFTVTERVNFHFYFWILCFIRKTYCKSSRKGNDNERLGRDEKGRTWIAHAAHFPYKSYKAVIWVAMDMQWKQPCSWKPMCYNVIILFIIILDVIYI